MSNWPIVRLETLATFKNGLNFPGTSWGRGTKIIGVSDFGSRMFPDYETLDEVDPRGVVRDVDLLAENDILFVRSNGNRELIGRSLLITGLREPVSHSGFTIRLRFREGAPISPRFYAYLFKSDLIRKTLSGSGGGTNINNLNQGLLGQLEVPVPPLDEQEGIAAFLACYDDLIANNQRRIALLESTAEEIYREWFVRMRFPGAANGVSRVNPPDGWTYVELPKLASITYGFTFAGDRFSELEVGKKIIRIRDVLAGDSKTYTDEIADDKYVVRAGDLLIGMDGEFHMNHWIAEDAYLVQRTCRVAAKQERLRAYAAHALRAPISHYQQTIVGATVGHLGAKHLNAIRLLVPPDSLNPQLELLNQFLDQRLVLAKQNLLLAKSRDALLPRLISGKLRVDALDIQFPPSMQPPPAEAAPREAIAR